MMQLELTEGEASALKQLIHFATMARGMEVAEAAVVLVRKIDEAAKSAINGAGNGHDRVSDDINSAHRD